MIIVETPVRSIEEEISRLRAFSGPNSETYARGAIEALQWVLSGTAKPSESWPIPKTSGGARVH